MSLIKISSKWIVNANHIKSIDLKARKSHRSGVIESGIRITLTSGPPIFLAEKDAASARSTFARMTA